MMLPLTCALRATAAFRRPAMDRSRRILSLAAAGLLAVTMTVGAPPAPATAATHTITWDRYSLLVDGQRTVLWSGEFHPFRLPSPSLWRDVLQKLKANGYNAV